MDKYEYTPFADKQSIRVLRLDPGRSYEPLTGSLDFVKGPDLQEFRYEPISYAWGTDHTRNYSMICDGRVLGLSNSLHGALQRFRLPDKPRVLWADQICINQNDPHERSNQIRFMHNIYQFASRVLVWLGEDVGGIAQSAFELLRDLSQIFQDCDQLAQFREDYGQNYDQQSVDKWKPLKILTEVSWVSVQSAFHSFKNGSNTHLHLHLKVRTGLDRSRDWNPITRENLLGCGRDRLAHCS